MDVVTPDWTILEEEGVQEVAEKAARRIAGTFADTIEVDDAEQEALIWLASNAGAVRNVIGDPDLGLGVLHTRIYQALRMQVRTEAGHRRKHVGYDEILSQHPDAA